MTEEDKIRLMKVKLKKYHDSMQHLLMSREDYQRYKDELLKNITNLKIYEEKKKMTEIDVKGASAVSVLFCFGLGFLCDRFNVKNETLNALISDPRFYVALSVIFALPLAYSHKIADYIIQKKYGKEIAEKETINQINEDKIESINQSLNLIDSDIIYTSEEIKKLENTIEILDETENEDFLYVKQPSIRQLVN